MKGNRRKNTKNTKNTNVNFHDIVMGMANKYNLPSDEEEWTIVEAIISRYYQSEEVEESLLTDIATIFEAIWLNDIDIPADIHEEYSYIYELCASEEEKLIADWLCLHKINFLREKTFPNLWGKHHLLRVDFWLPNRNIVIEYHGQQHFERNYWKTKTAFKRQKRYDQRKIDYFYYSKIRYIYLTSADLINLDSRLGQILGLYVYD